MKEAKRGRDIEFDEVWCVFDHEGIHKHESLERALDQAKANKIKVALSTPSFVFWYLLHYQYTTRQFTKCDTVISALKKYIKGYNKNDIPPDILLPYQDMALINAEKLRNHNTQSSSNWPQTDVDLLVKKLKSMCRFC